MTLPMMLAVKLVISFSVAPGKPIWSTGSLLRLQSEVNTWMGKRYRQREAGELTIRVLANQWGSCALAPVFHVGLGWGLGHHSPVVYIATTHPV